LTSSWSLSFSSGPKRTIAELEFTSEHTIWILHACCLVDAVVAASRHESHVFVWIPVLVSCDDLAVCNVRGSIRRNAIWHDSGTPFAGQQSAGWRSISRSRCPMY
jgi:hypothetical protein